MGLNPRQKKFCELYIQTANASQSAIDAGYSPNGVGVTSCKLLKTASIQAYLHERMDKADKKLIADSDEVMKFFTSVMRGEVNDQFGLDPGLQERINAGRELARRTIDIEQKAGNKDALEKLDELLGKIGVNDKQ